MKMFVATMMVASLQVPTLNAAVTTHPVSRVISLLEGLAKTSKSEGEDEALDYAKFAHWCKRSEKKLLEAIAKEKDDIATLTDDIKSKKEEKKTLENEIDELDEELKKLDVAATEAKDARKEEKDLYDKTEKDLTDTIAAFGTAIKMVVDAKGEDLMQVLASNNVQMVLGLLQERTVGVQRTKLMALLQDEPLKVEGDRAAHIKKYDSKADSIIELFKEVKAEFEKDKLRVVKEETNAVNSYDLEKQARDESITVATKSKDEKTKFAADAKDDLTDFESSLQSTQEDLTADSNTLSDTEKACTVKAQEWADRSKVRKSELEAIDAAIKILSKATGVSTKAPENPVPPTSPVSLFQVIDPRTKALSVLRDTARLKHSQALERLAQELSVHIGEPFDQVNNMIQKMIFRLMDEQRSEDEHKLWCDKELSKTNTSMTDNKERVAELKAKIDSAEAKVQSLTNDIDDAEKMVSDLTAYIKESTEIREAGKKENAQALKDAKDAQLAIAQAVEVLKTFYEKSGMIKESSLVQRDPVKLPDNPSTWDSGYTGVASPDKQPDGIISVLEKTASDFATMEADTKAQEATDQDNYEEEMKNSDIEKARRRKEAEMKTLRRKELLSKIDSLTKSKKRTSTKLESVVQYYDDLQPACVDGSSSYEDRKAARQDEMDALRKVQGILEDAFKAEDASMLDTSSGKQQSGRLLRVKRISK